MTALALHLSDGGQLRLQCERGWASVATRNGRALLKQVAADGALVRRWVRGREQVVEEVSARALGPLFGALGVGPPRLPLPTTDARGFAEERQDLSWVPEKVAARALSPAKRRPPLALGNVSAPSRRRRCRGEQSAQARAQGDAAIPRSHLPAIGGPS